MSWANELAEGYGKCLSSRIGPGPNPAPTYIYIVLLCPTALLIAFFLWLPVHTAMQQGVPANGTIHTVGKHGNPETESISSITGIVNSILIVCLPLLLSTIAYLAGWLGSFRDDQADFQNTPRVD